MAARSAVTRSVGAQPNARRIRPLTTASQTCSWELKFAGDENLRPGRNERSRESWTRSTRPLASGSAGLQTNTFAPRVPRNA